MNIAVQYITDSAGKPQAVQLSLTDWEALMAMLKKYEQTVPEGAGEKSIPASDNGEDLPYFDAATDWDVEATTLRASSNTGRTVSW